MSPFVYDLSSKHRRRLQTNPHTRHDDVLEALNFHRRADTFQTPKESFDAIINRWWAAFAIGGLILIMLLVATVGGLLRCMGRRRSKPLMPKSVANEEQSRSEEAAPRPVVSIRFGPPPRIMITPATAPPNRLRFSLETDETTLADLADYPKCDDKSINPERRPEHQEVEYQKCSDSLGESNFDGGETDISHVQIAYVHRIPSYHSEDPSYARGHDQEKEVLEQIDIHSPGVPSRYAVVDTPDNNGIDAATKHFVGRDTTMPAKLSAQKPSASRGSLDSDPDRVSGSGTSEPELTEVESSIPVPQFPLSVYPKASTRMHQTGERILPVRLEKEPHDDQYTGAVVPHFAFHRPAVWQNSPISPNRAANLHGALSPEHRSKHSPTSSLANSWEKTRVLIHTRSGPLSDCYTTGHPAMEAATAP